MSLIRFLQTTLLSTTKKNAVNDEKLFRVEATSHCVNQLNGNLLWSRTLGYESAYNDWKGFQCFFLLRHLPTWKVLWMMSNNTNVASLWRWLIFTLALAILNNIRFYENSFHMPASNKAEKTSSESFEQTLKASREYF